jgi:hypothetical protein
VDGRGKGTGSCLRRSYPVVLSVFVIEPSRAESVGGNLFENISWRLEQIPQLRRRGGAAGKPTAASDHGNGFQVAHLGGFLVQLYDVSGKVVDTRRMTGLLIFTKLDQLNSSVWLLNSDLMTTYLFMKPSLSLIIPFIQLHRLR